MVDQILEYVDQFCVPHLKVHAEDVKETISITSEKQIMGPTLKKLEKERHGIRIRTYLSS